MQDYCINHLKQLESEDLQSASLVKLRFFAGLTTKQAALALGLSLRTANRNWAYAKARLYQILSK